MDTMRRPKARDRVMRLLGRPVRIPARAQHGHDLSLEVDGMPLRVRSERTGLILSPEAVGTAFLLPAAATGRRLAGAACDPAWLENARRILEQVDAWWGWGVAAPGLAPGEPGVPASGVGLAFSLGVDSFHSCFFADPAPDLLILAAGFDVPLEREDILTPMRASLADIAHATGKDWTVIETDLRQHRLFRRVSWEASHGSAIAFLGHLLQERIGTLLISSSYDRDHLGPWGSHPDLDPLWSSTRLSVRSTGEDVYRSEKIRRLVTHPVAAPLMQRHLRVCWERPSAQGNCGVCHKCVLLRLTLHWHVPGFRLDTMPEHVPLLDAIEALPPLASELSLHFRRELLGRLEPALDQALRRTIERSEAILREKQGA